MLSVSNETAPRLSWREAEKKLKSLEPQLKKHRCHAFEPSEEPEDDEYDYMQIHNVEHYISEMKWHAKLNSHRDEIVGKLAEHASSKISTMELVEHLETLEGERVFPSFWLFHAPGSYDYRYGDWRTPSSLTCFPLFRRRILPSRVVLSRRRRRRGRGDCVRVGYTAAIVIGAASRSVRASSSYPTAPRRRSSKVQTRPRGA